MPGPDSGVKLPDDLVKEYNNFKLRKTNNMCIVFCITEDSKEFQIMARYEKGANASADDQKEQYERIMQELTALRRPLYIVWDLLLSGAESGKGNAVGRLVFIGLCPDDLPVKQRMMFSTSKNTLFDKIRQGIHKNVDAKDDADWNYEKILKELK